jgi:cytochrome c oxidase subunit II
MKLWPLLLLLFAVVACTQTPTQQPATPDTTGTPTQADTTPTGSVTDSQPDTTPDATQPNTVEIEMTAEDFAFNPNTITVHKGDHVIIHITESDDRHGLAVEGYNTHVEFDAAGGTLEFDADKAGTFTFFCNVPCGSGHRTMKGTLVVEA